MAFWRRELNSDGLQFQIAPMVDVVFLLLIFFLTVTTVGRFEGKIEANLPRVHLEKPKSKPRQIVVKVEKGSLIVNGKRMSQDAFVSKLKEIIRYDPEQYVFIDGASDVLHGDVIEIFDRCNLAGANVTIAPPEKR